MRLIEADYVTEKLNEINGTAELDKAFEVVENAPTVDVFDKTRAEIQENINYNKKMNYQGIVAGLLLTLNIIDKYKEQTE